MGTPHILAVPYPTQGHVLPLMELSLCLVEQGIRVTFVNSVFNNERVIKSLSDPGTVPNLMNLESIADVLDWEDRKDLAKVTDAILHLMPAKLEALIEKINANGDEKITCLIADVGMGWAMDVANKMGIRRAVFWPAAAAVLAQQFSIPQLIDDGIIDSTGTILTNKKVLLSPDMPVMEPTNFFWAWISDPIPRGKFFSYISKNNRMAKMADWLMCNSTYELEKATFSLFPEILPIGPLLASNRRGDLVGYFWPEDTDCLTWLDKQQANSVIYAAFGSSTVFNQAQFQELALALELTNMPFLWVVRQDLIEENDNAYLAGFKDRIQGRGHLSDWAPQQKVLSHPSIACFLSHCGWNSTIEGVSNGLPFLCWPYCADQFLNQSYICDVWKIGVGFNRNQNGIIERGEIKTKVEQLLTDEKFRARALDLKEKVMKTAGEANHSCKNLSNFVNWIKDQSSIKMPTCHLNAI